jgi:single-strand DNA-binding protein
MANDNTVTVVGNVTRDPELRYLNTGTAMVTLGLAVNRRWRDNASNEWKEETSFFDVVCWRDLADNVAESVEKGDRIMVSGRLDQRSWETQDGDKRSKVEIVADEVGPSLRWATASVTKIKRDGPREGGGRPQGSASPPPPAEPTYSHDEEPF